MIRPVPYISPVLSTDYYWGTFNIKDQFSSAYSLEEKVKLVIFAIAFCVVLFFWSCFNIARY